MNRRSLVIVVLILLIITTPYWIYLPAILISTFLFQFFWEGVLVALLVDALYGYKSLPVFGFPMGLLESILIVVFLPIRKLFRFHAESNI